MLGTLISSRKQVDKEMPRRTRTTTINFTNLSFVVCQGIEPYLERIRRCALTLSHLACGFGLHKVDRYFNSSATTAF